LSTDYVEMIVALHMTIWRYFKIIRRVLVILIISNITSSSTFRDEIQPKMNRSEITLR